MPDLMHGDRLQVLAAGPVGRVRRRRIEDDVGFDDLTGKRCGSASLIVRPLATFIKMYLIRGGFLEGVTGLVLSSLYAQYTFSKYAKLLELIRAGRHD